LLLNLNCGLITYFELKLIISNNLQFYARQICAQVSVVNEQLGDLI